MKDYYTEPTQACFVGREDAKKFMDSLSQKQNIVISEKCEKTEILIPDEIIVINKSFFYPIFMSEILRLGKIKFKEKYQFKTKSQFLKDRIDLMIFDAPLHYMSHHNQFSKSV